MRQPSILDVLRAVREVALAHPEVRAWWYAPVHRLRLQGALPSTTDESQIEVAIEVDNHGANLEGIAAQIAEQLRCGPVSVRPYRGAQEERQLYRLFSRAEQLRTS
jgi:hypothetical protein